MGILTYEQARQIRTAFVNEHIRGKPAAEYVSMVNVVRKWNDKNEPWYIVVHLKQPLLADVKPPATYKGLRVQFVIAGKEVK